MDLITGEHSGVIKTVHGKPWKNRMSGLDVEADAAEAAKDGTLEELVNKHFG